MTVRRDDMQHCPWNTVLVRECDAAEWMAYLLTEFSLDHVTRRVLVELEWFTHVGQQRTCDEVVALNRYATAERLFEDLGDGDALPCTGVQMLDEGHLDVAGKEREFHRTQLVESPTFPAATRGDSLAPNRCDLFAQRLVLDLPDTGKELRDFSHAVDSWFVCFHEGCFRFIRYF